MALGKDFQDTVRILVNEGKRECDIVRITGHSRNAVRLAMQNAHLKMSGALNKINEVLEKVRDKEKRYKCPLCHNKVKFPCV